MHYKSSNIHLYKLTTWTILYLLVFKFESIQEIGIKSFIDVN